MLLTFSLIRCLGNFCWQCGQKSTFPNIKKRSCLNNIFVTIYEAYYPISSNNSLLLSWNIINFERNYNCTAYNSNTNHDSIFFCSFLESILYSYLPFGTFNTVQHPSLNLPVEKSPYIPPTRTYMFLFLMFI